MSNQNENQIDWTNWISHELKTPLNRMESLLMSLDKSPKCGFEEKKLIIKLRESLNECKNTLDSLYFFNKIKVNKIKPKFESKDINISVRNAVQELESSLRAKGQSVVLELEPLFPISLDEQLFKRAFSNILENAIKFSPPESKILISTEELEDKVVIQIADQGAGIEEENLSKIFEPYYRLEKYASVPGTGLGLFIAKTFLELHQGSIEADSILGSGTTFTLSLPKERTQ